jgi:hypothetical protein
MARVCQTLYGRYQLTAVGRAKFAKDEHHSLILFTVARRAMRVDILIGILVASYASSAFAEDKSPTDTAYCIGVHQFDIQGLKTGTGKRTASEKARLRDLELRKERRQVELEHAIRQKKADYIGASKVTLAGYSDAKMCSQADNCRLEATKRIENKIDEAVNDAMTKECQKQLDAACERRNKSCD